MTRQEFVNQITPIVYKYCKEYGYNEGVAPAIIAQACVESNNGNSSLASTYFNYFGMKCGRSWSGKSVNLKTKEEFTTGKLTTISSNFRVYDNMDQGIKGYFDFINTSRYSNLKSTNTPLGYLQTIKADGYATSSSYVGSIMSVVKQINVEPSNTINVATPQIGKVYELTESMNVRSGAGTQFPRVGHNGLTADGKKHDKDKNGSLDKGTRITCKGVSYNGTDIWIKCPSGWVAGYYNGKKYYKEV